MSRGLWILHRLACAAVAAAGAAPGLAADDAALLQCRLVRDAAARLACYDALPVAQPAGAEAARGRSSSSAPPPTAAASSRAAPPVAPDRARSFGLEAPVAREPELESIASTIGGRFDGWMPRQRLRLANGQLWEISDGSEAAYDLRDPKVTITRGITGAFFMRIEGVYQTPRVRRIE